MKVRNIYNKDGCVLCKKRVDRNDGHYVISELYCRKNEYYYLFHQKCFEDRLKGIGLSILPTTE